METFTHAKPFVNNKNYLKRKEKALKDLEREIKNGNKKVRKLYNKFT